MLRLKSEDGTDSITRFSPYIESMHGQIDRGQCVSQSVTLKCRPVIYRFTNTCKSSQTMQHKYPVLPKVNLLHLKLLKNVWARIVEGKCTGD